MRASLTTSLLAAAAVFAVAPVGTAGAADLQCDTAKLIVPWSPGGGTDVIFRIIAESVNNAGAETQLQVVNIPGQGGNKGAKEAVGANPDGCTLFAVHQSAITSYFTGRVDFTWDAFEPIALLTRTPAIIGANPDVPYSDVTELVAAAQEKPGEILAGGTLGSTSHFLFLLVEDKTDSKFKHISYDGTRERMTALLAKNIELGEINLAAAKQYITSGELKGLGITTPERNPEIPDVKTLTEQGIDMVYGTDRGILAPEGTPPEAIAYWAGVLETAMSDPAVIEAMTSKGTDVVFMSGDDYRSYMGETYADWERIAKEVGVYQREEG
ncbi:MAG: tripartite tricarboxylate transporter substrate binding protein [Pseudomonadota bacterium]